MAENKPLNLSVEPQSGSETTLGASATPRPATGALLVDARKRKGLSVADVAGALRIRQVYLEAIEQGRLSDLPGAAYALGFVRTYAEYLGLDGNEIVRRFKDEADELGRKTELVFPLPLSEGRFPGRIVILVSIGLALFIYGVWHYTASRDRSMVELVPPPPASGQPAKNVTPPGDGKPAEAPPAPAEPAKSAEPAKPVEPAPTTAVAVPVPPPTAAPAPSPAPAVSMPAQSPAASSAPSAATPTAPAVAANPPSAPAASAPLTPNPPPTTVANPPPSGAAAPQANPPPPAVAAAAGSAPPPSEGPKVFGDESGNARIQLKAKADTWIQVADENGKVIAMRTLKPGEIYQVPNRSGLTLFTGNAGGLDVTVDGKKAPALGASGAVRRNVALEPDGLLAGE
ncbi:MAG: helix-turn-helix domain-containing protein [Alphaproteobacteria bacterium]